MEERAKAKDNFVLQNRTAVLLATMYIPVVKIVGFTRRANALRNN